MTIVNDKTLKEARQWNEKREELQKRVEEIHNMSEEDLPLLINGNYVEKSLMVDKLNNVKSTFVGTIDNPVKVTQRDSIDGMAMIPGRYSDPSDAKNAKKTPLSYKDPSYNGPAPKKGLEKWIRDSKENS